MTTDATPPHPVEGGATEPSAAEPSAAEPTAAEVIPVDRWQARPAERRGGAEYAELLAAQRLLQDRFAGAALPGDVSAEVAARLRALAGLLEQHQVPESQRRDGWRPDLPGRGMPLLPPYVVDEIGEGRLRGRISFGRFYLGANAAVHGGTHALLFDELLGHVAASVAGLCRTAYLTVNYRRITPLDVELPFEAQLDTVDGRKRFVSGRLYGTDGKVVADCSAMFLRLLPGQQ